MIVRKNMAELEKMRAAGLLVYKILDTLRQILNRLRDGLDRRLGFLYGGLGGLLGLARRFEKSGGGPGGRGGLGEPTAAPIKRFNVARLSLCSK